MENSRKIRRRNLIFFLAIIVGVSIFYMVRGDTGITYTLEEDSFTLYGPGEFTETVDLSSLTRMELRDDLELGTAAEAVSEGAYLCGTWRNGEFGLYRLCIVSKVQPRIVFVEQNGAVTVCNFESTQTTVQFYEALVEYMAGRGETQRM